MSFTIRNKMLIMFALLTSLVSALGGIWYHMTTQTIRNNTIKFSAEVIRQMNIRMDSYFAEIARLALPLTARNVSADFVDRSDQGVYERLLYSRPITKLFDSAMLGRSDLYGLSIVSDKGIAISSYSNLYAMARFENIVKELDAPGNLEIVGVSRYNDVQLLTMAVKFYSPGTHNWGILMIDARLNNISGISSESQFGDSGFVWVADQHNHYLYYPDEKMVGEPIPAEYALGEVSGFLGVRQGAYRRRLFAVLLGGIRRSRRTGGRLPSGDRLQCHLAGHSDAAGGIRAMVPYAAHPVR